MSTGRPTRVTRHALTARGPWYIAAPRSVRCAHVGASQRAAPARGTASRRPYPTRSSGSRTWGTFVSILLEVPPPPAGKQWTLQWREVRMMQKLKCVKVVLGTWTCVAVPRCCRLQYDAAGDRLYFFTPDFLVSYGVLKALEVSLQDGSTLQGIHTGWEGWAKHAVESAISKCISASARLQSQHFFVFKNFAPLHVQSQREVVCLHFCKHPFTSMQRRSRSSTMRSSRGPRIIWRSWITSLGRQSF
jgi:hypothetical protein